MTRGVPKLAFTTTEFLADRAGGYKMSRFLEGPPRTEMKNRCCSGLLFFTILRSCLSTAILRTPLNCCTNLTGVATFFGFERFFFFFWSLAFCPLRMRMRMQMRMRGSFKRQRASPFIFLLSLKFMCFFFSFSVVLRRPRRRRLTCRYLRNFSPRRVVWRTYSR